MRPLRRDNASNQQDERIIDGEASATTVILDSLLARYICTPPRLFLLTATITYAIVLCSVISLIRSTSTLYLHVHPSPVTLDEANEIVSKNVGRLFSDGGYSFERGNRLRELERTLSRDVDVDPNESVEGLNEEDYLLGTHFFWTGDSLDLRRVKIFESWFNETTDSAKEHQFRQFVTLWRSTMCHDPEYYASFITSHDEPRHP